METSDAKEFARQIRENTAKIVDNAKNPGKNEGVYRSDLVSTLERSNSSISEEERKALSESLVNGINEGTKKQQEYDAWYEKEYGSKNQHISSNSVPL